MNILYTGHSTLLLEALAYNHRNAEEKEYSMTKFRVALAGGLKGRFVWLVEPTPRTEYSVAEECDKLIREHQPIFNKKKDRGEIIGRQYHTRTYGIYAFVADED